MTHEEYKALVSRYEDFLCEVERMQLELGHAVRSLEAKTELSDSEVDYLDWMQDISSKLGELNS